MLKGFVALICFSVIALFTTSCGSGGGGGTGGDDGSGKGNNNSSPVAQITIPAEGSTFNVGDVIQFVGSCSDSEDGDLSDASLVWSSNLDGHIGTGETCTWGSLSAGVHQITLTGTDAEGAEGMDTVQITVNAAAASGNLPDTGQTTSYTDTFGEDSDYSIHPPAYTKLDDSGRTLDAGATDWTMVRDDVTGLIWEVKTRNDQSIHDRNNLYTWQDAQDVFISQLNSDNFGGYSDWRLPTVKELSSLIHADVDDPTINTSYFPHSVSTAYWTSTTLAFGTDHATVVEFLEGTTTYHIKPHNLHVRAVRGGQLPNSLVDNGDGTVTDTVSGLMWQQDESRTMSWEEALDYCETLELAGYDDWRLPNRNELQSIVDDETYNPSIDTLFFPGAMTFSYWSSTTLNPAIIPGQAWSVSFIYGTLEYSSKDSHVLVRAVRGGQ
jgi:hypothetical protein